MKNRIARAQSLVKKNKWDFLLIDAPIDLFYLTGISLSLGRLLISASEAFLFVDGRYFEMCQKTFPFSVVLTKGYSQGSQFEKAMSWSGKTIAFDAATTTYQNFLELEKLQKQGAQLIASNAPIRMLRQVKEKEEVSALRESAELAVEGFQKVIQILKEGISEKEVALELELFWKKRGGDRIAFDSIIAFQENASQPHYRAGNRRLKQGDLVLIDIGVIKNHYVSDMTRVVAFGKPSQKWEEIYQIVREAQEHALACCTPGVSIKEADQAARDVINKSGLGEFFTHSLGHGIGLELHELPMVKKEPPFGDILFEPGMVVTIEPGIYLPDEGGIRLEDAVVITPTGHENLTALPLSEEIPVV